MGSDTPPDRTHALVTQRERYALAGPPPDMAEPGFDPILLLFVVPLGLLGAWGLASGLRTLVVWWRLRASDAAAAYDLRAGPVELDGRASVFDTTVPAPFTDGGETLLYHYDVERYRPDDDGSDWETVDSGTVGVPFVLTCDGVDIVVDPTDADLHLSHQQRIRLGGDETPTGALARFIEDNDEVTHRAGTVELGPLSLTTGTTHRFTASRLDPGERVYVAGTLTPAYDARLRTDTEQWVVERQPRSLGARLGMPTPLTIADAGEAVAQKRIRNSGLLRLAVGLVFGGLSLGLLLGGLSG